MLYTPIIRPSGFVAFFDSIAPALNKYMALLYNNAAGQVVQVSRVFLFNTTNTAVAGTSLGTIVTLVSAYVSGTPVTPMALDTSLALPAGIEADTNSSGVVAGAVLRRVQTPNEEVVNVVGALMFQAIPGLGFELFSPNPSPIVLRQGEGVAVQNLTNSTVGNQSYAIEFTVS